MLQFYAQLLNLTFLLCSFSVVLSINHHDKKISSEYSKVSIRHGSFMMSKTVIEIVVMSDYFKASSCQQFFDYTVNHNVL